MLLHNHKKREKRHEFDKDKMSIYPSLIMKPIQSKTAAEHQELYYNQGLSGVVTCNRMPTTKWKNKRNKQMCQIYMNSYSQETILRTKYVSSENTKHKN